MAAGVNWSEENRECGWFAGSSDPEPICIGNDDQFLFQWLGLGGGRVHSVIYDSFEVALPHWLWVLLAAIPPLIWTRCRLRDRQNTQAGLCITCGYDLRASTERCPECGTAITHAQGLGH